MHSLIHPAYGNSVVAERAEAAQRVQRRARLQHPPPIRSRAAYAAARIARRLDSASARKAIA
jgi:hypothetical protein